MTEEINNKPEATFERYPLELNVWKNNGIISYDISKKYKNKEGEWKKTTSFNQYDTLNIIDLLKNVEKEFGCNIKLNK